MKLLDTSDWTVRARKIYDRLHHVASTEGLRIGFTSPSAVTEAIAELKRFGFQKTLFSNRKKWLRQLVIESEEAYVSLAPNTKLEFIVDGHPRYWRGHGDVLDYKDLANFANKAGDWVLHATTPVWISIKLGFEYKKFSDLLEQPGSNN